MRSSSDEELYLAASMYYLQDWTMEAIARRMGVSRSTVSRMLKRARDVGVVSIKLASPEDVQTESGADDHLRGVRAHVVSVADNANEYECFDAATSAAAQLLNMWFDSNQVLGVAWGTTTSAIAARLQPKPTQDSLIVQFNGAGNVRTSGVSYAGAIIQKFSRAFSANMLDFPVPAFFDSPLTKEMMWRERSVRRVLEAQERADIAVFSVGGFGGGLPSHVYAGGYLEPGELDALQEDGVVGDVCTVFLRGDGSSEGIEINRRATGPSHDKLRQIPRRILVASGKHKVAPLLGALRAGLATDLVVDDRTFKRLNAKALREARGA